jgi:1-pyrroline-5-carboxylate dehydrogenase
MGLFPFQNEPFLDFADPAEVERMRQAVAAVGRALGRSYPLRIGGERVETPSTFVSRSPENPDEVVGVLAKATPDDVERAIAAAARAFPAWSRVPAWDRAALLLRAGHILRTRRREMLGWLAYEVGKNWSQGDGEVAEAIDHFEWNARAILEWDRGKPIQPLWSEFNEYRYIPLGVGVVISPWNFPTTLPLGMVVAAIAAGNTVVLKPAEDASVIAHKLLDVLEEAGLPAGVVNLVTGAGSEIGTALVTDPRVRFVAFVGSKEVGVRIHREASGLQPGQTTLRRVMTEMGGKNATVVAADADFDWAVSEVAQAAFGYQGQKCSATSRVIVEAPLYERFVEALAAKAEALARAAGPATENAPFGPVINEAAVRKILSYVARAPEEGRAVVPGGRMERPGFYVQPAVVADVAPTARLFREEIFGPVVSVTPCRTFEEGIDLANDSDYALTGSVFARDPARLAYARERFYVGNLYLNRSSTGAMAGVHPFGGYRGSGTGPKVGGPDYLGFYLQAQTITEKVRY